MQHHLLPGGFERLEDLVLGAIHDTVQQQIRQEVSHSDKLRPRAHSGLGRAPRVLVTFLLLPEEHEGSDADGDESDNEVFIRGEFASVENDVHEHDGDKFARFREDHRRVRYVG